MFSSFCGFDKKVDPKIIIDHLEKDLPIEISTFGRLSADIEQHQNTYLLCALAWSRLTAAHRLLKIDRNNVALNLADCWPTSRSTPLLLAAKIGATSMMLELIERGADVNATDYRGFTALHYACMLRDNEAIEALLSAGAVTDSQDIFGEFPIKYYQSKIEENDFFYLYGYGRHANGKFLLHEPWDKTSDYAATYCKALSAFRWFIAHILINKQMGQQTYLLADELNAKSIHDHAKELLVARKPVMEAQLYEAMMRCFCEQRPNVDTTVVQMLKPAKQHQQGCDSILNLFGSLWCKPQIQAQEDNDNTVDRPLLSPV